MPLLTRVLGRPVRVTLGALVFLLALAVPGLADAPPDSSAQDDVGPVVEILPLEGLLDPPTTGAIIDLIRQSTESELIVIQIDAPGAVSVDRLLEDADRGVRRTAGHRGVCRRRRRRVAVEGHDQCNCP
jgi:hypothetical protein